MQDLVLHLSKRRAIMMGVVVLLAILAIIVSFNFKITPTSYFGGSYNNYFLFALIVYKLIELPILYYLLLHRHVVHVRKYDNYLERLPKIKKHTKLLLFLIPQGNTIFGIIAYKLSGNVMFFLLFSSIAIITLFLTKPDKLL
ncbi:MAG: hypothetical protein QM497_09840 [Sulfurimonas sp.]